MTNREPRVGNIGPRVREAGPPSTDTDLTPSPRTAPFEVIPGIDLRGGRCVRLVQGDFARETVFADDPAAVARRWQAEGAPRLHVVDLEGSRDGETRNLGAVEAILRAVSIPVQM